MSAVLNKLPGLNTLTTQSLDDKIGLLVFRWGLINTIVIGMGWFHKNKLVEVRGEVDLLQRVCKDVIREPELCDALMSTWLPYMENRLVEMGMTPEQWDLSGKESNNFVRCYTTQLVGVAYSAENFADMYNITVHSK